MPNVIWERGMSSLELIIVSRGGCRRTSAHYSTEEDGAVTVINRGYSEEKNAWKESQGKARVLGEPDVAALKFSFFGFSMVATTL